MSERRQAIPQPVHFIGIGGAGMSAIALVLARLGVVVTGSDLKASRYTRLIEADGVAVTIGHHEANLGDAAVVVISSAIPETNPELAAARRRGLPVLQRAEMLARVMAMRRGIAVAGTHGKTTTSSMIAHALHDCGRAPTFLIGGEVNDIGANAGVDVGEWLVAEADESDGSLLFLRPEVGVITNVELDHHSHYTCLREVQDVFRRFVRLLPADGQLVLVAGSGGEYLAAETAAPSVLCAAVEEDVTPPAGAAYVARLEGMDPSGSRFTVLKDGEEAARVHLRVPGVHNVLNALCALAALEHAGVPPAEAAPCLSSFSGAARRFQETGRCRGVVIVDDYAHHPSELTATLRAARLGDHRRVIAVFQPHLYSRTRYLQRELGRALTLADEAVVTDIFASREEPEPGVTGKLVVDAYIAERPHGPVAYLPRLADAVRYLSGRVSAGDLVLTLGAGDVFRVGEELLAALAAGQGDRGAGGEEHPAAGATPRRPV